MTLIKSISGIRGTMGGKVGENLTPIDLARFTAALATYLRSKTGEKPSVVVGRDARISGPMCDQIVTGVLRGCGVDVINIGLASTPTTEMAVTHHRAHGGIILTASHNGRQWNALKLLNGDGEFLSAADGAEVLSIAESEDFYFADIDNLGEVLYDTSADQMHIDKVLSLPQVDVPAIIARGFRVAVDAVNSVGGTIIPVLLRELGCQVVELNCTPDGNFAHNPEPLAEHLTDISALVVSSGSDLGVVVDPDVDRLALITPSGQMFGEEYTLVAVADYILGLDGSRKVTVSNLSSSRALADIASTHHAKYQASAVGEVNVVAMMKQTGAIIGGEGNGGVIFGELHYGRDALVGVALLLTMMAKRGQTLDQLRAQYPHYQMCKYKMEFSPSADIDSLLAKVAAHYANERITTIDGVKIDTQSGWVHLRRSNTEPIVRVYSEAPTIEIAQRLAQTVMDLCK